MEFSNFLIFKNILNFKYHLAYYYHFQSQNSYYFFDNELKILVPNNCLQFLIWNGQLRKWPALWRKLLIFHVFFTFFCILFRFFFASFLSCHLPLLPKVWTLHYIYYFLWKKHNSFTFARRKQVCDNFPFVDGSYSFELKVFGVKLLAADKNWLAVA